MNSANLLSLPLGHFLANAAGLLVCLTVMVVCICRVDISEVVRWRLDLEQLMLLSFALWACGTAIDLVRGRDIGVHNVAAGFGILLYFFLSYRNCIRIADGLADATIRHRVARWNERERRYDVVEEDSHAGA